MKHEGLSRTDASNLRLASSAASGNSLPLFRLGLQVPLLGTAVTVLPCVTGNK